MFQPDFIGFYGKLPSRGDFVTDAIARGCVDAWDEWARAALYAGCRDLGKDWTERWMAAPIWRFRLKADICGTDALIGAVLPSVDAVGRQFPLIVLAGAADPSKLTQGAIWLESAIDAAVAAITQSQAPDILSMRLRDPCADSPLIAEGWWTEGGPYRAEGHYDWDGLPAPRDFSAMIADAERVVS